MYLGNDLQVAFPSYRNIDDISGSFDGVTTSFPLLINGSAPVPAPLSSNQCLISVNGVVQEPDDSGTTGFRLSGGNIVFSAAPTGGHTFFGVVLAGADYVNAGVNFPDGTLGAPSITFDQDTDTGYYRSASGAISFSANGVASGTWNANGVSAPAFSPTSSSVPSNGIYLPATNSVAISTNGTGRLFVDASGRLGLGTSDINAKLQIQGSDAAPAASGDMDSGIVYQTGAGTRAINIGVDNTNNFAWINSAYENNSGTATDTGLQLMVGATSAIAIDSSRRVGIGTTSVQAKFHVSNAGAEGVEIEPGGISGANLTRHYNRSTSAYINNNVYASNHVFHASTSEVGRWDSSGRLLVNTSSAFGTSGNDSNYSFVQIKGHVGGGIEGRLTLGNTIASASITAGVDLGSIWFADGSGGDYARILAEADGTGGSGDYPGRLVFSVTADGASSPSEAMRITNDRYVRLASGSGGIQFGGDTAAANALDDYEEGTWNVTLSANLTADAAYSKGYYVKIGSLVWINYSFKVATVSGSDNVVFSGLPFANSSNTADTSRDTFLHASWQNASVGDRGLTGYMSANATSVTIFKLNDNALPSNLQNSDLSANDFLWISGSYRI